MAYDFTISIQREVVIGGARYTLLEIDETEIDVADEWSVPSLPDVFTITSFKASLIVAGSAATLDPRMGVVASFVAGSINEELDNASPAADVAIREPAPVIALGKTLYGRSTPDVATGVTGEIKTRIALRWGH